MYSRTKYQIYKHGIAYSVPSQSRVLSSSIKCSLQIYSIHLWESGITHINQQQATQSSDALKRLSLFITSDTQATPHSVSAPHQAAYSYHASQHRPSPRHHRQASARKVPGACSHAHSRSQEAQKVAARMWPLHLARLAVRCVPVRVCGVAFLACHLWAGRATVTKEGILVRCRRWSLWVVGVVEVVVSRARRDCSLRVVARCWIGEAR
jgi:hypothetical protein